MNFTNATSTEDSNSIAISIFGLCLSAAVIGFHFCAIYASVKSKELQKVRFLRLTLFLSLSDSAIGIEFMYGMILNFLNTGKEAINFQCMLIRDIASGTIISSLLHTLLICFERLNASFSTKQRILNILTSNISVGLCFAIPHAYTLSRFGINLWVDGIPACGSKYTIKLTGIITHDLPVVLLIATIAGVYGVVAKRMIKQKKTVEVHGTILTETQMEQQRIRALRMRKNMATLGMIIIIAVVAAFPRAVLGIYINISDSFDILEPYLDLSNLLLMLTPLLDPVIYLFRIEKYREQLFCKCC